MLPQVFITRPIYQTPTKTNQPLTHRARANQPVHRFLGDKEYQHPTKKKRVHGSVRPNQTHERHACYVFFTTPPIYLGNIGGGGGATQLPPHPSHRMALYLIESRHLP